jgi:uncharacterized protein (DUF1330 family)|tara:strand:+ start:3071 stop:3361 length:291 start_codon:yes stop_codon:yes gene_type:complete
MSKGYWLATYKKIENKSNLGNYAAKATDAIKSYGGNPLVRGGKYKCLEGNDFLRTVIWEFPTYETAEKCYNSKEYQEAWSLAKSSTERNLEIVEGL